MIPSITGGQRHGALDAVFDFNFLQCEIAVATQLSVSGGANGARVGSGGTFVTASGPRLDFNPLRRNCLRNSTMKGAVAGVGAAGVLPTYWDDSVGSGVVNGLTRTIAIGKDAASGYRYVDITWAGTASATFPLNMTLDGATSSITAANGQAWTLFISNCLQAGSYANLSGGVPTIRLLDATGGALSSATTSNMNGTGALAVTTVNRTTTTVGMNNVNPLLQWSFVSGQVYNFTTRLLMPQVQQSAAATTFVPTYDSPVCEAMGLLVEEARTNAIPNPTFTGATVGNIGSGGVMPTGWNFVVNTTTGLTRRVNAVSTEDGKQYLELQLSGTATGAGSFDIQFGPTNSIAASAAQAWSLQFDGRISAGSLTANMSGALTNRVYINGYNAGGGFLSGATGGSASASAITAAALLQQSFKKENWITPASTAFVGCGIFVPINNAEVINVTIRIGVPMLEQAAFCSARSHPSNSARSADSIALTASSLAVASGTYLVELTTGSSLIANGVYWGLSASGDSNNTVYLWNSGGTLFLTVKTAGVSQAALSLAALAAGTTYKVAISLDASAGEVAARVNGGAEQFATGVSMPATVDMSIGRAPWGNFSHGCVWHRRDRRWARVRRNELQTLST